jgi:hypothetical protein
VLPRSKASAVLLLAAVVMATVATTLVAAVPLYSDAIIEAGLRSTLEDAPPAESGLEATFRSDAAAWVPITAQLDSLGAARLPGDLRIVTAARTDTYSLPAQLIDDGRITTIGTVVSELPMFQAVEGPVRVSGGGVIAGSLHVSAAELLGLGVGDRVDLARRDAETVTIEIIALVEPVDRFDELWFDQPVFRDGLTTNGSFTEVGPFLVDSADFSALTGTANYRWRVIVDPESVTTDDLDALQRGAAGMERAVGDRLDVVSLDVATDLPALVAATDTAIGSTAAVIAAILLQLVGVALYGVGLSASVLVSSRVVETSMLRSRGATAEQLGMMAAAEALLIAIPAVALGPWLGLRVVEMIERWGPVASTGLDLRPTSSATAQIASAIVGVFVVAIVTLPAVRSASGFASTQATRARPEGPLAIQRTGLDIGVVVLAVLGLWRLSGSSAATSDLAGRLGTDPVLTLAPTLGVIAGSLLTLRVIALVAASAQRLTSSQGALPVALAGWELARRPGRTARTSVLIVLSVTVGTFAAVHGASWQQSLRDQADASVSADAVVVPDGRPAAEIAPEFISSSYRSFEGVEAVIPVDRPTATLSAGLGTIPVVATDTRSLADSLRLRDDLYGDGQTAESLGSLATPGELGAIELGDVTGDLIMSYDLTAELSEARGSIRISAVLLDGSGTVVRVEANRIPITESSGEITFRLTNTDVPGLVLVLEGPLRLIELEISAPSVQDSQFAEEPLPNAVFDLELRRARVGARSVSLAADWTLINVTLGSALAPPSANVNRNGDGLRFHLDTGLTQQASATLTADFGTGEFGRGEGFEVPVFVTQSVLDVSRLELGDVAAARVSGISLDLRLAGVLPVVPFAVDEQLAVLVDWETLNVDRWARARRSEIVDEWALTAPGDVAARIERTLVGPPYSSASYVERRQEARDIARAPVTVGLSGSLGLALASSMLIATIGLVLTAVVGARERRPAFAVLRAMGTRASELRRWLLLETVPLVGLSAIAGLASGIALARLALPSLAGSRDGLRSVPAPILVVPWATLALIVFVAVSAGMALPIVAARLLRRHRTADELRIGDTS